VIPTHNRERFLYHCLKGIFDQECDESFEVIVINDGISLTSIIRDLCKNDKGIRLEIVEVKKRIGGSRARNIGIDISKGDIIAFLDDDSIPLRHWLRHLIRAYDYGSRVGGVGGRIISSMQELNKCPPDLAVGTITPFGHTVFNFNNCYRKYVDWVRGCNMSFKKDVLNRIGGIDEILDPISQSEDIDLCFRVKKAGFSMVFEPNAVVIHMSANIGGIKVEPFIATFWNIRNTTYVYFKNLGNPHKYIAITRCFLGTLLLYIRKNGSATIITNSLKGLINGLTLSLRSSK